MESLKKVGRIGGMALLYFEVVSTIALVLGLLVANIVHPGHGFNLNTAALDARSVSDYAGQAKAQSVPDFLIHIIPTTVVDAFAKGDILEVVFVALLFGFALSSLGAGAKPIVDIVESLTSVLFGVTKILMKFAPAGAFGAMAYTVGKFGLASLGPLAKLIGTFWLTSILFVIIVLGLIAWAASFSIFRFLAIHAPNAIWQADHTPLDILLIRPDGEIAKPWLTVVIDDYSRAVAGYFLSFEDPSSLHTSLALCQAIWRKEDSRWIVCGIPAVLYTDHGSDFTSGHLEQVSADLKIRLVFSLPGKPRGRGRIERFFLTVNELFLCELDGYAPAGGTVRGKPTLTLAEFEIRFRTFLLEVYHRREHAETKTPPVERWEANGFLPQMPDSLEQLDLLLIQVAKTRQVRVDGIYFQSLRYTSTTLAAYVGETVTLRFDPRDLAEIRVFHEDRFLCRAVCAELAGATVSLRDILRARSRRRRELRGVLRDRQSAVDSLLEVKRGETTEKKDAPPAPADKPTTTQPAPALKRYWNE